MTAAQHYFGALKFRSSTGRAHTRKKRLCAALSGQGQEFPNGPLRFQLEWAGCCYSTFSLIQSRITSAICRLFLSTRVSRICNLGGQLMDQAVKADISAPLSRALLYRDGLIIALLTADPLRNANITALEMGRTLIKDGTTWSVDIPAEEMKNRRPHLAVLPDWATPCIDRYVDHYWPMLGGDKAAGRLWLESDGQPLDGDALYRMTCKKTREAFGKPINPHLFRSCLATSTAIHHGASMGLAMTVLGHQSSKVTTRYYNQAKMIDAVRAYQVVLAEPEDEDQ